MVIGILSDTHGRAEMMAAAVELLRRRGAEFFIHCGDVGDPSLLDHLAGVAGGFVWGNTDWDRRALRSYAQKLGVQCWGAFGDLEIDQKRIAVIHGDDHVLHRRLLDEQRHDYLCFGHTHVPEDRRVGRTRLINPGALHRAARKSVALVDAAKDELHFEWLTG